MTWHFGSNCLVWEVTRQSDDSTETRIMEFLSLEGVRGRNTVCKWELSSTAWDKEQTVKVIRLIYLVRVVLSIHKIRMSCLVDICSESLTRDSQKAIRNWYFYIPYVFKSRHSYLVNLQLYVAIWFKKAIKLIGWSKLKWLYWHSQIANEV